MTYIYERKWPILGQSSYRHEVELEHSFFVHGIPAELEIRPRVFKHVTQNSSNCALKLASFAPYVLFLSSLIRANDITFLIRTIPLD